MALVLLKTWEVEEESSTAKSTSSIIREFRETELNGDQDAKIHCAILDVKITEEQKRDAESVGVKIIPVTMEKMLNPDADLPGENCFLFHDHYYPQIKHLQNLQHVAGYIFNGKNTAAAIHESLFPEAKVHRLDVPEPQPGALFVNDDWDENDCGLTGFHRTLIQDFCARKAKVAKAVKAYSTVLDVKISEEKKKDAKECGVTLIPAVRKERAEPEEDPPELKWLLNHESYFPDLKKLKNIKHVIGYAPKTAKAAAEIRERLFRDADLVMINHAYEDHNCLRDVNWEKIGEKMLKMASEADIIFSIGPKMHGYFTNQYRANIEDRELAKIPHKQIFPKPRRSFFYKDPYLPDEINTHQILTYGQFNSRKALEPHEALAGSISDVTAKLENVNDNAPVWQIVGVSSQENQTDIMKSLKEKLKNSNIKLHFYTSYSAKTLLTYLHQSHLCLPSSCYKDYPFCGLEAMATGIPTFAFKNTDLGQLISQYLPMEAESCVVKYDSDLSAKIIHVITNTELAFEKAQKLKEALSESEDIENTHATFAGLLTPRRKATNQSNVPDSKSDTKIPVHVHLDEDVYQQQLECDPNQSDRQRIETAWKKSKHYLKRRAVKVINSDSRSENVRKIFIDEFGHGVEISGMTAESLLISVDIPRLINLYRLEGSCRSKSLSDALEPILITDEMRSEAATVGMPLKLTATYNPSKFDELELFFLNRDGGGIQPIEVQDGNIEEASAAELRSVEIDYDTQRAAQVQPNDRTDMTSDDRTILENRLVDAQQEINVLRKRCEELSQIRHSEEKVAAKLFIQSLKDKDEKAEQKTAKQEDECKTTMSTQQRDAGIAGPSKSELPEEGQREKGQSSQSSIVEPLRLELHEGTMKEPTQTDIKRKLPIGQKDGKAMADQSKRPKMPKESKRAIPEWKPMTRLELLTGKRPATFASPEYRLSRRLSGPQNGQPFKYPKGLAFIGNLLAVCDSDNSMVQIVNQDYVCESVLGTFDGQFKKPFRPVNVAVSKHKHYFIIDEGNLQIVVCDETKTIIKLIDLRLLGADSPTGIALQNGFILVTDQKVSKLMKLTRDGKCVGQYKEGFPHSVAVNSNDVILVTDNATSRIKCFDSSLNLLHQYCTPGNKNGQLLYPRGIDVDEQNNVFICDWNNHRAVKFKPGGEWQCTLFQIRCPEYIAVADDGRVAVTGETHSIEIYVPSE